MIFQNGLELVLIQWILIGFEAILQNSFPITSSCVIKTNKRIKGVKSIQYSNYLCLKYVLAHIFRVIANKSRIMTF